MAATSLEQLNDHYTYTSPRASADCVAINCPIDRLFELLTALRDEESFDFLTDVTAVDWDQDSPRFSVVYHLYSTKLHAYLRVVSDCADDEKPVAPSVVSIWPAADWLERETYDLFGIQFAKHPDLRRILMWEDYPYHPLRKDFPLAGKEVDLPAADIIPRVDAKVIPAPMAGGPFTAGQGGCMSKSEPRAKDQSWNEQNEKPTVYSENGED